MSLDLTLQSSFEDMGLIDSVMSVLDSIGFMEPTPIQTMAIPTMMKGRDILGQAQTGTGKTAAFALPILSKIDTSVRTTQALILVPTRELAIQLAEAIEQYSANMNRVSVMAVYGGQDYREQFRRLKNGVHVVVGTPGRVMDHMRRDTLNLKNIKMMVLDEADEMLQMGFIDDITWILEQTPEERQTCLFSATLPLPIRKIAQKHMKDPEEIIVKLKTASPVTINQRYISVNHSHKIETLSRIIESEKFDGMLVFVRTKATTMELVESLESRGYAAEALNGDLKQAQRERTVERFKNGKIDVLVATDVAARGLDVDRISHVINFDIPHDIDTYIHRVGRTGRAGRKGEAILFATHKERRMLDSIERFTKQKIALMEQPSADVINKRRVKKFKEGITDIIEKEDLAIFAEMVKGYCEENDVEAMHVAAALAKQIQGKTPFLFVSEIKDKPRSTADRPDSPHGKSRGSSDRSDSSRGKSRTAGKNTGSYNNEAGKSGADVNSEQYRIEVGKKHGAKPGNIVGCIANEAGIDSQYINKLKMFDDYTTVELPAGMPAETFLTLKKAWVGKRQLNISKCATSRSSGSRSYGSKRGSGEGRKSAGKKSFKKY